MMTFVKDVPFIDTLSPILAAAALWCGLHIFFIGPQIVAPRLTAIIYQPACHAGVKQAWITEQNNQRLRSERILREKRARLRHAQELTGALLGQYFGPELGNQISNSPLFNPLRAMPDLLTPTVPGSGTASAVDSSAYCSCIVSDLIGKQVPTGLHSASLRIWKPQNIRDLEGLATRLVTTPQCSIPDFRS